MGARVFAALMAAVVLALAGALAVQQVLPARRPRPKAPTDYTLAELRQLPEEHLFYPGAAILGQGGHDRGGLRDIGPQANHLLGAQATPEELYAFYDRELAVAGWGPITPQAQAAISPSGAEESVRGWLKGDIVLRVSVRRKGDPRNPPDDITRAYTTIYLIMVFPVVIRQGAAAAPAHAPAP